MKQQSKKKRKLTRKDFTPKPDPVWHQNGNVIELHPFFLSWWQKFAEHKFGDKDRVLDAAVELGYMWKHRDQNTGEICYDPIGFDYNPVFCRNSLGISQDMPLISSDDRKRDQYNRLWQRLLIEKEVKND